MAAMVAAGPNRDAAFSRFLAQILRSRAGKMHSQPQKLDDREFAQLIRVAPLVSIDIILRDKNGNVLLALRADEPAGNYFFVPGGRIFKNETIKAAFERIVRTEVGCQLKFEAARLRGVYEHFYANNRFEQEGYGTHYVVLAYEAALVGNADIKLDSSQRDYKWFDEKDIRARSDVHDYVKGYFES
jgi:colanic acid biosynthesis protein WcaH